MPSNRRKTRQYKTNYPGLIHLTNQRDLREILDLFILLLPLSKIVYTEYKVNKLYCKNVFTENFQLKRWYISKDYFH